MICIWTPSLACCPYCGNRCCRKVRDGQLGQTCGAERCKRKAQKLPRDYYRAIGSTGGKRKKKTEDVGLPVWQGAERRQRGF
jgi:hypothetical protein